MVNCGTITSRRSLRRNPLSKTSPIQIIHIDDNGPASAYSTMHQDDMPSTSTASGDTKSSTTSNCSLHPRTVEILKRASFIKDIPHIDEILDSNTPYTVHDRLQKEGKIAPLSNTRKRVATRRSDLYPIEPFPVLENFGLKRRRDDYDEKVPISKRRNTVADTSVVYKTQITATKRADEDHATYLLMQRPQTKGILQVTYARTPQVMLKQLIRRPRQVNAEQFQTLFKHLRSTIQKHVEQNYDYALAENQKGAWPLYHLIEKYPSLYRTTLHLAEQKSNDWLGFFTKRKSRCALVYTIIGEWLKHRVFEHPCFGINDSELESDLHDINSSASTVRMKRAKVTKAIQKILDEKSDREHAADLYLNSKKLAEELMAVIDPLQNPINFHPKNRFATRSVTQELTMVIQDAGAIAQTMRMNTFGRRKQINVVNTIVHSIPIGGTSGAEDGLTLDQAIEESRILHRMPPHDEDELLTATRPLIEWLLLGALVYGAHEAINADWSHITHQIWETCPDAVKAYISSMNLDHVAENLTRAFKLAINTVADFSRLALHNTTEVLESIWKTMTSAELNQTMKRVMRTAAYAPSALAHEYTSVASALSSIAPDASQVNSFVSAKASTAQSKAGGLISSSIPAASSALSDGYVDATSHVKDFLITASSAISSAMPEMIHEHIPSATSAIKLLSPIAIAPTPTKTRSSFPGVSAYSRWKNAPGQSTVFEKTTTKKTLFEKVADGFNAAGFRWNTTTGNTTTARVTKRGVVFVPRWE